MAIKKKEDSSFSVAFDALADLKKQHGLEDARHIATSKDNIVDIMTFCNDPLFLNLAHFNMPLFLSQRVILKAFYMGSRGNEKLSLTEEEWGWLYQNEEICEVSKVIEKIKRKEASRGSATPIRFSELTLVLGRRSSKTALAAIIAVYEAYKVLVINNGDPYGFYKVPHEREIAIINVATSKDQSHRLFAEIRTHIRRAPFFANRISTLGTTTEIIRLYTDLDLRNKQTNTTSLAIQGSILVYCGHSNPDSLRGWASICLVFDELAFYDESAKTSGREFFEALSPSVAQFAEFGDGIKVEISSPGPKTGIFYEQWKLSLSTEKEKQKAADNILSFRMPTWLFNPLYTYENPELAGARARDKAKFDVEYGAEWPEGGLYGFYFPEELIADAIAAGQQAGITEELEPLPGEHFIHIDPALTNNNYALVVVRKEAYYDHNGALLPRIIVVYVKVWTPQPGVGLNFLEIDDEVVNICRKFKPIMVGFDQWNCCKVGTLINSENGLSKVEDLQVGEKVISQNGETNTVVKTQQAYNVDGYKIRTKFGYQVEVNSIHPLLVKDAGFVKANELSIGDTVCLQNVIGKFGINHNPIGSALMGYLISEGSYSKDGNLEYVRFSNCDQEVIQDYCSLGKLITGEFPKMGSPKKKSKDTHFDGYDVRYFAQHLVKKIKDLGFSNADCYTKTVPDFVLNGDKETVSSFLSSLYEGDGNVAKNPNVLGVEYNTASKNLARQIQVLLLGFGIKSSLKYFTNKFFRGKRCPFYRVMIYGDNVDAFQQFIGFRAKTKQQTLAKIVELRKTDLRALYNKKSKGIWTIAKKKKSRSQYMYDRIVSIEPITLDIIHLEVSGDHTYISNGIISHNSAGSMALLARNGISLKQTSFNRGYKMRIYQNLKDLMIKKSIYLYEDSHLVPELRNLKYRPTPRGVSIGADVRGEVGTDDCADCLAGAAYLACGNYYRGLPAGGLVWTGFV